MKRILIGFLLCLPSLAAQAQFNDALNYQDCLLQATREGLVLDKQTVGTVKQMCLERFPDSAPTVGDTKLNEDQLAKIDIWTRRTASNDIEGEFYNGNPDVVVTQFTILLTPVKSDDPVQDFFESEEYEVNLRIMPYKTKTFRILAKDTDIEGEFRWSLVSVWGY
jgi:hypothetical protein